ncbi:hypothetical protein K1719_029453 [Acacia pycnantha]|nr:hypothetical protein K1719_029453 [Acacia pycnantha]
MSSLCRLLIPLSVPSGWPNTRNLIHNTYDINSSQHDGPSMGPLQWQAPILHESPLGRYVAWIPEIDRGWLVPPLDSSMSPPILLRLVMSPPNSISWTTRSGACPREPILCIIGNNKGIYPVC